ncbi:transposable element Tcb2 transposase [Trichonephila clavipes]|nr:transposable element Tcb2 transposase [Trichonephila clavipes]
MWRPRGEYLNPVFAVTATHHSHSWCDGCLSQDCLRTFTTLPWPARSPDLPPIEHIWDNLGRLDGLPMSLNEQEAKLQQIWNEMSQDIISYRIGMPQCPIVSHRAFALEGVQHGIKSSVLLPFSLKK